MLHHIIHHLRTTIFGVFVTLLMTTLHAGAQQNLPQVCKGRIERIENFRSRYVAARNIDVWLPEGYSDTTKYAVLYMQDGQNLFDSTMTWNKQSWDVDDVATELFAAGLNRFIVVGVWNSGFTRYPDYFPQKPFESLTATEQDSVEARWLKAGRIKDPFSPNSDLYLKFLVKELKPYIEKKYAVYTDRSNTVIAGSSSGALLALYALCEYPRVFGKAGCLSTHWTGTFSKENNPVPDAMLKYLNKNLPDPDTHKIYFDCGDQKLDALYPKFFCICRGNGDTPNVVRPKRQVLNYFIGYY